ncbi:MAG: SEC-C metal-binding domain-containing protein, partial [Candidatus Dormibacteria bacterium]
SMGQRDPLVEFKSEAFASFSAFQESLKQEIVRYLFHAEIQITRAPPPPLEGLAVHPEAEAALAPAAEPTNGAVPAPAPPHPQAPAPVAARPLAQAPATTRPLPVAGAPPVSRNALCPCGSGRKYKRCHGQAV